MQLLVISTLGCALLWSVAVYADEWRNERRPNFFAMGSNDSKIQMSLQRELLDKSSLYFAYTLRGLWLRDVPSTPFKELTHQPEMYWTTKLGEWGYEHLSNGLDNRSSDHDGLKKRSRSLQRLYWQDLALLSWQRWKVGIKLMVPVYVKSYTPYHDYLGYQETILSYQAGASIMTLSGSLGPSGGRLICDISWNPLTILDASWAARNHTWLFLQYYQGYAETLVDYNRQTTALRLGLRLQM